MYYVSYWGTHVGEIRKKLLLFSSKLYRYVNYNLHLTLLTSFSQNQIEDDHCPNAEDIGTISLDILGVEIVGSRPTAGVGFTPIPEVHEQSAKDPNNVVHQTQ